MARALKIGAAVLASAAMTALLAHRLGADPRVAFLASHPPAVWLRAPGPAELRAKSLAPLFTRFRASFEAPRAGLEAELSLRARSACQVFLDGREVLPPGTPEGGWKEPHRILLRGGPGRHELRVVVRGDGGPPLLWAEAPALALYSGPRWQASVDGATWAAAQDAQAPLTTSEFDTLPSAAAGFSRTVLFLLPFLVLGIWLSKRLEHPRDARRLELGGLILAAAAWAALAAAVFAFLHPWFGYDARRHAQYVEGLARTWRLPAPGDGWQTFQPPLYYLLGVPLRRLALALGQEPTSWLRAPSLVSGFLLGLSCRWFVQAARPGRRDLSLAAGFFGWFWPASLYVAQAPSNEPLAGALAGLFLAAAARQAAAPRRATAREVSVFLGAAFVAGGWFYARNWAYYGVPFIGGWNPARGIA